MSSFGKMSLLLTSKAKQVYAGQTSVRIWQNLTANEATIKATLGVVPKGFILVTDTHPSKSDAKTHYTIDAYDKDAHGLDKPIGTIHMYQDNTFQLFTTPRSKAWDAYIAKLPKSSK